MEEIHTLNTILRVVTWGVFISVVGVFSFLLYRYDQLKKKKKNFEPSEKDPFLVGADYVAIQAFGIMIVLFFAKYNPHTFTYLLAVFNATLILICFMILVMLKRRIRITSKKNK